MKTLALHQTIRRRGCLPVADGCLSTRYSALMLVFVFAERNLPQSMQKTADWQEIADEVRSLSDMAWAVNHEWQWGDQADWLIRRMSQYLTQIAPMGFFFGDNFAGAYGFWRN